MNFLYGLFDFAVAFGRIAGICFMLFFAMFLGSIILLELMVFMGIGTGAYVFNAFLENPPELLKEFFE